ncbi:MAG: chemotaxis protein CheD [Clostridiales bacterium GWE2_32_10]|nr:MAG: chemotaxis protein CheD [Clostridiales bacterium GWE2_32_10]HBY20231.1 chemotaxis protein CheD [Clostridiales bacterium]
MINVDNIEIVKVGMGDLNIVTNPGMITTLGLGSCVAIVLYDNTTKIAGMAHVMLPNSKMIANNSNRAKFMDTAIIDLISIMEGAGVKKRNLVAKIAGGAQMFDFDSNDDIFSVGRKNIQASRDVLHELNIPIIAEDTGKNYGRTVEFYTQDGSFKIKSIGKEEKII